jgi:perosamine synthetase
MSKNKIIPQMQPHITQFDKNMLIEYINSDAWYTEHEVTKKFELDVASFTKVKHAIAVNNGTVSLSIILLALGLKEGDEYIVPNYTMIATANSGVILGAKPIFCDVELPSLYLDLEQVESKITKKTKAIIVVNANGRYPSYKIEDLLSLCDKYNINLVEDTAQGLGSFYPDGTHLGTKGIASSISFSMPKIITTGQGGMILTNDDDLAYKIRRLKDFGRSKGGLDIHETIGYNFKFTDIQATLGVSQMFQLDERIKLKKEIYQKYYSKLSPFFTKDFYLLKNDTIFTAPWFFELIVNDRLGLKNFLKDNGVITREMYPPINKQVAYGQVEEFPNSNYIGEKGLWIPSYVQLQDEEINFISDCIIKFITTQSFVN